MKKSTLVTENFISTLKFEYSSGHIYIKTKVENQSVASDFIFDTGAGTTVSPGLSERLHLKTIKMGGKVDSLDPVKKSFPMIDSLSIGTVSFVKVGAVEVEPSQITDTKCKSFEGIIGANIMRQCIWQINYETNEILSTDELGRLGNIGGAIKIPFTPAPITGSPLIKIVLNDSIEMNWILDTGFNGFITFSTEDKDDFLKKIPEKDIAPNYSLGYNSIYGKDSTYTTSYLINANLKMAGHDFSNLPLTFGKYKNISNKKNGVIGNKFLENFIVTIDWKANNIYLLPLKNRELPHNQLSYGLNYGFQKGNLVVGSIWKNSEAEKQGIKAGDQIVLFEGKKTINLSQEEICTFFDGNELIKEGKLLNLTILRDNKETAYTLKAQRIF
ncbi:hypothetical protein BH11BAC7_BH11BAC7_08830 [soil metagenome]